MDRWEDSGIYFCGSKCVTACLQIWSPINLSPQELPELYNEICSFITESGGCVEIPSELFVCLDQKLEAQQPPLKMCWSSQLVFHNVSLLFPLRQTTDTAPWWPPSQLPPSCIPWQSMTGSYREESRSQSNHCSCPTTTMRNCYGCSPATEKKVQF